MTAFVVIVVLLMVSHVITWARRRGVPSWEQSLGGPSRHRRSCRHRRFGDHRRRREAADRDTALVAMLAASGHDPAAHLSAGVIFQPGAIPGVHSRGSLLTWETE